MNCAYLFMSTAACNCMTGKRSCPRTAVCDGSNSFTETDCRVHERKPG